MVEAGGRGVATWTLLEIQTLAFPGVVLIRDRHFEKSFRGKPIGTRDTGTPFSATTSFCPRSTCYSYIQ